MKLYVVTADGWTSGWGCSYYLIGVYDNKEEAEKVANKTEKLGGITQITEIILNKTYKLKKCNDSWGELVNNNYIGGYIE